MKEILDVIMSVLMVGFMVFLIVGFFKQKQARDEKRDEDDNRN